LIDYSKIATTAIRVTINNPLLWFFGIFLAGGFNFNWLFLSHSGFSHTGRWAMQFWRGSLADPDRFVWQWVAFIIVIIFGWVILNWVKIIFIYNVADLLNVERLGKKSDDPELTIWRQQKKLFRFGRRSLSTVLGVSVFVALSQGIVSSVLSGPLLWQRYIAPIPAMVVLGTGLFILFMLLFSLLNFFGAVYAVLYHYRFHDALAAASRLIRQHLKELFITCILLLAIYTAGVVAGLEVANAARAVFTHVGPQFDSLDVWHGYTAHPDVVGILFLLWLGFLNAVFNVGLFLFFQHFVKPTKFAPEKSVAESLLLKVSVDKSA
jgi:MFS family permease